MPKICPWAKYQNRHGSKSIWVIKMSFCQKDPPIRESFWQKDSLITRILFQLCLFWYLAQGQILGIPLYPLNAWILNILLKNQSVWKWIFKSKHILSDLRRCKFDLEFTKMSWAQLYPIFGKRNTTSTKTPQTNLVY